MSDHDDASDYAGLASRTTAVKPAPSHAGCKYYGKSALLLKRWGRLEVFPPNVPSNQCAISGADTHAPCRMEMDGAEPNEITCPIARDYVRAGARLPGARLT